MALCPPRVLALCAGYGGLELALKLAMPSATAVCYVEREAHAAAVLVARMEVLGVAPIWSDVATFDGRPWRGAVDIVAAGYPCRGESNAGPRSGTEHTAWLWPQVWRIVREVGPSYVFLENVAAHLGRSFRDVVSDLAQGGWRVEWDCVPAAAVGAPHLRDRVFILAAANPDRAEIRFQQWRRKSGSHPSVPGHDGARVVAPDSDVSGLEGSVSIPRRRPRFANRSPIANSVSLGDGREGIAAPRLHDRWPLRDDPDGLGAGHRGLSREPWAVGSMPEPTLRRVDDGAAGSLDVCLRTVRNGRLYVAGNGVVPQAGCEAFETLWERVHER